jgi:hypothetical protein
MAKNDHFNVGLVGRFWNAQGCDRRVWGYNHGAKPDNIKDDVCGSLSDADQLMPVDPHSEYTSIEVYSECGSQKLSVYLPKCILCN